MIEKLDQISFSERNKEVIDTEIAREHLNEAPEEYYDAINQCSKKEYKNTLEKLSPLKQFFNEPNYIVSVGVGGGLEVAVLADLFKNENTKIIGLDLADNALKKAKKYLKDKEISASFIQSSAVYMPFKKEGRKIDGFVFSAVMHEIYSYVSDGKYAWKKAIQEASESMASDGILLLRDFAAPAFKEDVELFFETKESRDFYEYFRKRFRTFSNWKNEKAETMKERRIDQNDFPEIDKDGMSVIISPEKAAEMMLHFRNYQSDVKNNCAEPFGEDWKEIDERYLPFNPSEIANITMAMDIYIQEVIKSANEVLAQTGQKMICLKSGLSERPEVVNFFQNNFRISGKGIGVLDDLFRQIPAKMELIFKKVKIEN